MSFETASVLKRSTSCPAPRAPAPRTTRPRSSPPQAKEARRRPAESLVGCEVPEEDEQQKPCAQAQRAAPGEGGGRTSRAEHRTDQPADPIQRRGPLERTGQADERGQLQEFRGVIGVDERAGQERSRGDVEGAEELGDSQDAMPKANGNGGDSRQPDGACDEVTAALAGSQVVRNQEGHQRGGRSSDVDPRCRRVEAQRPDRRREDTIVAQQAGPDGIEELAERHREGNGLEQRNSDEDQR